MKKRSVTPRNFKCDKCGYVTIAFKKSSRRTSVGHLKVMYCPFCKDTHNFIQISNY